jgi:tRNA 2-thiouridine synthesizing protein A
LCASLLLWILSAIIWLLFVFVSVAPRGRGTIDCVSDRRGSRGRFGLGLFGREGRAASPVSPVTDAARAAALGLALPEEIPPGASPVLTIDALGRKCPIPIIMLAGRIGEVPVGAVIAVLADDPAAYSDVPAWCALKSHDCVFRAGHASGWSFGIRRGY